MFLETSSSGYRPCGGRGASARLGSRTEIPFELADPLGVSSPASYNRAPPEQAGLEMPGDKDCKEGDKAVRVGKPRPPSLGTAASCTFSPGQNSGRGSSVRIATERGVGVVLVEFYMAGLPLSDSALPYSVPGGKRVVAAWALSARRFALPSPA